MVVRHIASSFLLAFQRIYTKNDVHVLYSDVCSFGN